jgi:hypothetical protein
VSPHPWGALLPFWPLILSRGREGWLCKGFIGWWDMGRALVVSLPRNVCRFDLICNGGRASRGTARAHDLSHRSQRSISHQPSASSNQQQPALLLPYSMLAGSIELHSRAREPRPVARFSRWLKQTESAGDISYHHHSPARAGTSRSARDGSAICAPHL